MEFLLIDRSSTFTAVIFLYVIVGIFFLISIILRGIPPFSWVYNFLKWFVIFFLVMAGIDMAKKSLKDWWDK
jgi:hypothetical protein